MRDAARALDDVSDHLGEVLRRADQLLAEWAGFGGQVRAQVERDVASIGTVVDSAVTRAASAGLDRAFADRLRAMTTELERLEQRTRAASRAVAEQRAGDRRVLWVVVAGVVVANALLVALLLRRPAPVPVVEPIRMESPQSPGDPAQGAVPPGSTDGAGAAAAGVNPASAATNPPGSSAGPATRCAAAIMDIAGAGGAVRPMASPIALPPKGGAPRPHKKLP